MPIYYNNFIINHWVDNNLILCGKINNTFNNKYDIIINKKENKMDNNDNNDNDDNNNNEINDEIKNIYYYDNTKYNIIKKKKYKIYKSNKLNNKN